MYLFSQINILIIFSCFTKRKNEFWFYWHSHKLLNELTEKWHLYDMEASTQGYGVHFLVFHVSFCAFLWSFFFPSIFQSKNILWYNSTVHWKSRTNQNQKILINGFKTCTHLTKEHCWEKSSMTNTWKHTPGSWFGRLNSVQIAFLP